MATPKRKTTNKNRKRASVGQVTSLVRIFGTNDKRSASPKNVQLPETPRPERWLLRERSLMAVAARQYGVIARRQLLSLGFSDTEILGRRRAGRLRRLHQGVYYVGAGPLTRLGRWLAAVLACGPRAFLSHRSAAALGETAEIERPRVDVTVPGNGSREREGIRIHRTRSVDSGDVIRLRGIPVSSAPRTLLELAGDVPAREVRRAYEEAVRLERIDPAGLAAFAARNAGRRGIGVLRALIDYDPEPATRTRSDLERDFLDFCAEFRLPRPLVNTYAGGYEVDAIWPSARLIVELDGWEFHRSREAFERDRKKSSDLTLAGFNVERVTDRRLKRDRPELAAALRRHLRTADGSASEAESM